LTRIEYKAINIFFDALRGFGEREKKSVGERSSLKKDVDISERVDYIRELQREKKRGNLVDKAE
jgi:hypothetical protein